MAAAGTVEFWKYWEGRVVDNTYPLLRCLGSGPTSAVFLTEAAGEKGRRAALRLVRSNSPGAELQLSRWQKASKISHPNLIRLLTMGRCQLDETAMFYLVMEYADENLSQVLPDRALTETETSQMLAPVISALQHVHRSGYAHGHLKPANIMAIDDQVKISSDNLWSINGRAEHRATPGPYDPPEIALEGTSPAGDVWSLGVTLVEVLTQHRESAVPETLPPRFADIARHCLQLDPKNRWTVDQIAEGLNGSTPPPAQVTKPLAAVRVEAVSSPLSITNVAAPQRKGSPWRYILPVAALAGVGIAAMLMFRSESVTHSDVAPPTPVIPAQTQPPPQPQAQAPAPAPPPIAIASPRKDQTETVKTEDVQPEPKKSRPVKPSETRPAASGEILDQVMPATTQHAQNTVRGKFLVEVRVHVDPAGSVSDANLELRGPSKYFAELTLQASRKWKFRPSDTAQDWVLHYKFEKSGVTVVPVHITP